MSDEVKGVEETVVVNPEIVEPVSAAEISPAEIPPAEIPPAEEVADRPLFVDDGSLPKEIWIDPSKTVIVTIYAYKDVLNKELISIQNNKVEGIQDAVDKGLIAECPITFKFTIPDFRAFERYKSDSQVWSNSVSNFVVDASKVKQKILRFHLEEVDLLDEKTGEPIVLRHETIKGKRCLSDESEELLSRLHPSVLGMALEKYKTVACINF